jgi:hypothetical protein
MSFTAAWLGVGARVHGELCRTGTVARAVSTVAQVGNDWRVEQSAGGRCEMVKRTGGEVLLCFNLARQGIRWSGGARGVAGGGR